MRLTLEMIEHHSAADDNTLAQCHANLELREATFVVWRIPAQAFHGALQLRLAMKRSHEMLVPPTALRWREESEVRPLLHVEEVRIVYL